jgi:general secretion pathway protein J
MTRQRYNPRGLTLIELIAAMAIFALVAVMGLQGLTGMMRMRDRLSDHSTRAAELEVATGLIRADLAALVPMLFYPAGGGAPRSAARSGGVGRTLGLSIGGQKGLDLDAAPHRARVVYRLSDDGTLLRQVWGTLTPADATASGPEVAVLSQVKSLSLRSYWPSLGWRAGLLPTPGINAGLNADQNTDGDGLSTAPEVYSSTLPLGIELTLDIADLGPLTMTQSLR